MNEYLVTRKDALRIHSNPNHRTIGHSNVWPIVVEASCAEHAVNQVYEGMWPGSNVPNHREFVVVPMNEAIVINHKPKKEFIVSKRNW